MGLRPHRRNLVVWSQSDRAYRASRATRPARFWRLRRRIRIVFLFTVVGLLPLARAVRARWPVLLAGTALTVTGIVMRDSATDLLVLLPGLLLLLSAPLLPATTVTDRMRHSALERELALYTTSAQRRDLEATLDQYPDDVTRELRDILTAKPELTAASQWRAFGRY